MKLTVENLKRFLSLWDNLSLLVLTGTLDTDSQKPSQGRLAYRDLADDLQELEFDMRYRDLGVWLAGTSSRNSQALAADERFSFEGIDVSYERLSNLLDLLPSKRQVSFELELSNASDLMRDVGLDQNNLYLLTESAYGRVDGRFLLESVVFEKANSEIVKMVLM